MKIPGSLNILILLQLICITWTSQVLAKKTLTDSVTCSSGPCSGISMPCPAQCPTTTPNGQNKKACIVDCSSPICAATCINRAKPNCNGRGAACQDPRFIGRDGVVFYFHGKSNEHFSLVSDTNLQINARFIGHRPAGRTRDYTWIQALGILSGSHSISLEATKAAKWEDEIDHLKFSYDGEEISLSEGALAVWNSPDGNVKLERVADKNSVILSIPRVVEIAVNVVPITKEEDRVHNYQIPSDDCFAHLEVQFRFFGLSAKVDGVIGRTYQPDYETPAKLGDAMPVFGGEDKYRTTSLLSADCKDCLFKPNSNDGNSKNSPFLVEYGTLKCSSGLSRGVGIVCKK
ncbi:OLC1v1022930C1 [Oldenlandia corymbosa var. corymbosa]|uniref:OLC1v1022930C1 n=1 Tax=Oldenlandia corymbosa var. corymbosa TaxID=529605 RepID=A0AAV1C1T9_OLDCO|nr:OLC1v1022930C1 [Oldenlandia corymbosa var. corymbosa]